MGALIAVHGRLFQRIPQAWAALASWAGLAVIMVASVTLTGSSRYPGALVAIPTFGAALVVAAGAAQPKWGVERLLRRRTFQFLAAISFPLYLWHWPILQIAAQARGVTTLPVWDNIGLLLVAGVLATVTYHFFENPIRHSRSLATRRWASLALGGCLIAATLTFTTVAINLHQQEALATPGLAKLSTGAACPAPTRQAVRDLMGTGPATEHRTVARILLVGDSTACTMLPGLEAVGTPVGVRVENGAVIGCGVVSGQIAPRIVNDTNVNSSTRACQSRANAAEARAIRSGRPNIVLWASSWEGNALLVGNGPHQKVVAPGSPPWKAVLLQRMNARVRQFTASGATVVMVTQAPFATGSRAGQTTQDEGFAQLNALLARFAADHRQVKVLDLANRVCPTGPPCPLVVDGIAPRGDGAHYSAEGSLWVARWLLPQVGIAALDRPDNPLPVMRVVLPANGATLKGNALLVANASFDIGIVKIELQVTGAQRNLMLPVSADARLPAVRWDTTGVPNGTYSVRSIAYGADGQRSVSKPITVRVENSRAVGTRLGRSRHARRKRSLLPSAPWLVADVRA